MSEPVTTEPAAPEGNPPSAAEQARTFTQAEVDQLIADRLKREGVRDLKAKAAEYDKLLDAQKTAEQKAAERQADAEKRAADAESKALRYEVASEKGISKADADLFLTGTDRDTIAAQAERLTSLAKARPGSVPNEGRKPSANPDGDLREFTRQLFDSAKKE